MSYESNEKIAMNWFRHVLAPHVGVNYSNYLFCYRKAFNDKLGCFSIVSRSEVARVLESSHNLYLMDEMFYFKAVEELASWKHRVIW